MCAVQGHINSIRLKHYYAPLNSNFASCSVSSFIIIEYWDSSSLIFLLSSALSGFLYNSFSFYFWFLPKKLLLFSFWFLWIEFSFIKSSRDCFAGIPDNFGVCSFVSKNSLNALSTVFSSFNSVSFSLHLIDFFFYPFRQTNAALW